MKHYIVTVIFIVCMIISSCSSSYQFKPIESAPGEIYVEIQPDEDVEHDSSMSFEALPAEDVAPPAVPEEVCDEIIPGDEFDSSEADLDNERTQETNSTEIRPEDVIDECAVIAGNILPKWFVYTSSGLILATLFTMCYISRQRRFSRNYRD